MAAAAAGVAAHEASKLAKAAGEVAFWASEVRAERHEMHHEGRQAEEEQPSAFAHWGQVEDKLIDMADTLRRARARIAAARTACGCEAEVAVGDAGGVLPAEAGGEDLGDGDLES